MSKPSVPNSYRSHVVCSQRSYPHAAIRQPLQHGDACGVHVVYRRPDDGDSKEHAVCVACQTVHYENPLNVVGTVPFWGENAERALLCKRNIEPRRGKWTLPAGFMELGEASAETVHRT